MIQTSCHCGNIKLNINELPSSVTSCNCSICNRIGALWAYYNLDQVKIVCEDGASMRYLWGEKTMEYHRCAICGCTTHYTTTENDGNRLIAVNFRMAHDIDIGAIPVRVFDGKTSWRYLDE